MWELRLGYQTEPISKVALSFDNTFGGCQVLAMNQGAKFTRLFAFSGASLLFSCSSPNESGAVPHASTDSTPSPAQTKPVTEVGCGDNTCEADEDCRSCSEDCGECPPCHAQSCDLFAGVPPIGFERVPRWDLDLATAPSIPPAQQSSTGGSLACGEPRIQIALSQITVVDEVQDFDNDEIYCVIQAESAAGYSVLVTQPTSALAAGEFKRFSLSEGLVWGVSEPINPKGNLKLTYDCFELKSNATRDGLLDAIGLVTDVVLVGTGQWQAVGTGTTAASAIKSIVSSNEDDHRITGSQTLDARFFAPLALGGSWLVSNGGSDNLLGLWGWELEMQLWGCAEFGDTGDGCQTTACYGAGVCGDGKSCNEAESCCADG